MKIARILRKVLFREHPLSHPDDSSLPELRVFQLENRALLDCEGPQPGAIQSLDADLTQSILQTQIDYRHDAGPPIKQESQGLISTDLDPWNSLSNGNDDNDNFHIDLSVLLDQRTIISIDGGSGFDTIILEDLDFGGSLRQWDFGNGVGRILLYSQSTSLDITYRNIEFVNSLVQTDALDVYFQDSAYEYELGSYRDDASIYLAQGAFTPEGSFVANSRGFSWDSTSQLVRMEFGKSPTNEGQSSNITVMNLNLKEVKQFELNSSSDYSLLQTGLLKIADSGLIEISSNSIIQQGTIQSSGGQVFLDASRTGYLELSGQINVANPETIGLGGQVRLMGQKVVLVGTATIDATGSSGGGTVYIGGGPMGQDKSIDNSHSVVIGHQAAVLADASKSGRGGNIVVWGDFYASVHGFLSASSHSICGYGGFIETSSGGVLDVGSIRVLANSPSGNHGVWLIDPYNITITSPGNELPGTFIPSQEASRIDVLDIVAALESGLNVTVSTGLSESAGSQSGHIWIDQDLIVNLTAHAKLTLVAAGDIYVNRSIIANTGLLSLEMNSGGSIIGGLGRIAAHDLSVHAANDIFIRSSVKSLTATSSAGDISIDESDSILIDRLDAAREVRVVAGDELTIVSLVTPEAAELIARSVMTGEGGSITADRLIVEAQDNVSVTTTVGRLDARSETGSIEVVETDSIVIDRVEAARGVKVVAGDALTIVSLVTPEQAELIAKSVMTGEGGSITADRLILEARDNISVTTTVGVLDARSETGSIEVVETDSIVIDRLEAAREVKVVAGDALTIVSLVTAEQAELIAKSVMTVEGGSITADRLIVEARDNISVTTTIGILDARSETGSIEVMETDSIRIDRLESALGASVTAGDAITVVSLVTAEQAELIAKSVMNVEGGSITADRLLIDAQDNVSVTTTVASLDARSLEGSITVTETDSLRIDRLESALGASVTAGDAITIVSIVTPEQAELIAKSVMTVEGGSITADRLLVDAQDNVSVTTTMGFLDARSVTGSIEVVENDSIQIDRLDAAREVKVVAGDAITIVSLVTPQAVELRGRSVKSIENGSIQADRLTIAAEQEVDVRTAVASLDARSLQGTVTVTENDSIQIDRLESALGASVTAGDAITIVSLVTPQAAELRGRSVKSIENGSIQADRLTIAAEQEVDVRTAVASLDARSSEGSITVNEIDSLKIDRLESALGASVTAGDAITIVSLVTPQAAELRGRSVKTIENGSIQADRLTIAADQEVDVRTTIASLDARSSEGSVTVTETDSIRIDRLEAALGATVTAGDAITIVSLVTAEQAELIAKSVMTVEGGSITADRLIVEAQDNVSVTTTIGTLDARSQTGSIKVVETDSIQIDRLDAARGAKVVAGDAITIVSLVTPEQAELIARSVMTGKNGLITADQLTVVAQGAINLSTAIRRMDAKSQAGDIAIKEIGSLEYVLMNTPGRAEIYAKSVMTGDNGLITAVRLMIEAQDNVSVKTTVGVLDAKSKAGSIKVMETDSIDVVVIHAGTLARLNAQQISIEGNIQASRIEIDAKSVLNIKNHAILATESGYVFGSFLNYQDKSNPNDTRVIDQKQTKSLRNLPNRLLQAEIQLELTDGQPHGEPGKVMASGLKVELDWGAGKGNGPESVVYPNKTSMFMHRYLVHPNALNPSEDIIVKLRVSDLAKGTIVLNEKGSSLLTNQKYQSSVIIPVISTLPVFAVAIPQPSTIVVPQRPRLQVDTAPVISRSSIILNIDRSISSSVQVTQKTKRIYLIAEVSPESGRDDKRDAILLKNNKDTDEYQAYDLKKLPELFKRLPDNRYQVLLREDLVPNQLETFTIRSSDRIILDVIIKDGQARSVPLENSQDQYNDR